MDPALRERLSPLDLGTLAKFDGGRLNRQFVRKVRRVLDDISEFPLRAGKPEPRQITIVLTIVPEVAQKKKGIESGGSQREIDVPVIVGLSAFGVIKDKLPIYRSNDVNFAVDVKNDRIMDARFNPNNSQSPNQMEFDLDDDDDGDGLNALEED